MTSEARPAARAEHTSMQATESRRIVRVTAVATHRARYGARCVARIAARVPVFAALQWKTRFVTGRSARRGEAALQTLGLGRWQKCRSPARGAMTLGAIVGERGPRGISRDPGVARMDVGAPVVLGVTAEAIRRGTAPLAGAASLMTLGAIGERVHAGEWQARESMALDGARALPAHGGVATITALRQAMFVCVFVTASAHARDALILPVAGRAGRALVLASQREPRARVIETAALAAAPEELPAVGGVTRRAIEALRDGAMSTLRLRDRLRTGEPTQRERDDCDEREPASSHPSSPCGSAWHWRHNR